MENKKPLIALVTSTKIEGTDEYTVNPKIKALIEEFGGEVCPVEYKHITGDELADLVKKCDGVLLPGGGDMDPEYYDEDKLPECGQPDPERDTVESALLLLASSRSLPVFGICRGAQVINVFYGGTLWQDLPSQKNVMHRQDDKNGPYSHYIGIAEGSALAGILGTERLLVNSYHHQAVKDPAPDFVVSAVSESDGIIECVECMKDGAFILGVQWHPESVPEDPASKKIFSAFMDAVRKTGGDI